MVELNITGPLRKKAGIRRMNAKSLKIDMTPMVDLGFLLIAFFIFTTEISRPAVTNLYMPHDGDITKTPDSKSLTILLGAGNVLFYYYGIEEKAIRNKEIFQTSYDELTGLGKIIRQKQTNLEKKKIDKRELIVLIKPGKECSYQNVVSALDEMLINAVTRYAIVDPTFQETDFLNSDN
jgi:biopolymer transport protein ExbD